MIEWPAIDHRLLLWQNQKYGVTGFLYWGLDTWRDNLAGEKRWPEVKWNPATWRNDAGKAHNGDGQLLYPGPNRQPLSSIRLENFRDGCEDYEYLLAAPGHAGPAEEGRRGQAPGPDRRGGGGPGGG